MSRRLATILLALVGAILLGWNLHQFGAGLSPDSVGYLSVARHLVAGQGLLLADGSPLVNQPPLYPVLLAFGALIAGVDPITVAPWLNVVLFGLTIFLTGALFTVLIESTSLAVLGTAAVALSPALVGASMMAWSEPLFITLLVASLWSACAHHRAPSLGRLVVWAGLVAAATLTRYIGLALIAAGPVTLVLPNGGRLSRRVRDVAVFLLVAVLPIALLMLRNHLLAGSVSGDRAPSDIGVWMNVWQSLLVIGAWFLPGPSGAIVAALAVVVLAVAVGKQLWHREKGAVVAACDTAWARILLPTVGYALLLLITATFTALDPLDDRLWSPMVVPIVLFLFGGIEALHRAIPMHRRWIHRFIPALLVCWLAYPLSASFNQLSDYREAGGLGFGSQRWTTSPTMAYIRAHRAEFRDCHLYSNEPEAITILTGVVAEASPIRRENGEAHVTALPRPWPPEHLACLVWFDGDNWDDVWSVAELSGVAQLISSARLNDGNIFRAVAR